MTSNFNVKIEIDAQEKTKAIFDSINTDNKFYPENPTETKISYDEKLIVQINSNHIPQLRANLNSTLRLIQASYDSIESVRL
jgi:KEOPS complex subunit Pcc1